MNLGKVKMMKYDLCQDFKGRNFFYAMILRWPTIAMWCLFVWLYPICHLWAYLGFMNTFPFVK